MRRRLGFFLAVTFLGLLSASPDTPDADTSWSEVVSDGDSIVFGRFTGKFGSSDFTSRRVRIREVTSEKVRFLGVDDGLGYIAEKIPPGTYTVESFEALYRPPSLSNRMSRPLRQRYGVTPKTGEAKVGLIVVTKDHPVYIGTLEVGTVLDGVVYEGHKLRIRDEFDEAFERLATFYPALARSLESGGIDPMRQFMLKPSKGPDPLERVVGLDEPVKQAREYVADGKFKQAINWLETFMPTTDSERNETRLLVGEALFGDGRYQDAIDELGEVLLVDPSETRALRLLARAHAFHGDAESAENLYGALAEVIPEDVEAHLHLGYLYALSRQRDEAAEHFRVAFQTGFDYLLHDIAPFYIAIGALEDGAQYEPPEVVKYQVKPPQGMDSRRGSQSSSIAVVIDHEGKVVAARISSGSTGSAPHMMVALVNARYRPASLNGVPVPALIGMGQSPSKQ